jgi:hypothetical protein
MIDGNYVRVGQQLEGYTLVAVDNQSATFAQGGIRVQLDTEGAVTVTPATAATQQQLAGAPLSAP